jgi:hypothetical protein
MTEDTIGDVIVWLSANSVDEDILSPLLEGSEHFSILMDYFNKKRKPLKLYWVKNSILSSQTPFAPFSSGLLACVIPIDEGIRVIVVRDVPLSLADETTIAHELAHLLIELEGFPLVKFLTSPEYSEQNQRFLLSINNMFHDPLVIRKLKSFGYDLRDEYILECREATSKLQDAIEPRGRCEGLINSFTYVQNFLENEILFKDLKNPCRENNIRFGKKYKISKKMGRRLLELIRERGYQTPDELLETYMAIIEECKLSDLVEVHSNIKQK